MADFSSCRFKGLIDFRETTFPTDKIWLLSVDTKYQNELNSGKIPDIIQRDTSYQKSIKSTTYGKPVVFVVESGNEWLLSNPKRTIIIRRNKKYGLLSIYHIHNINFDNVTGFSNMKMKWFNDTEKSGKEEDEKKAKGSKLKGNLKYNETFYIALIKNFRDMGWFTEADDCYYTYRVEKRKRRSYWTGLFESIFLEKTFGYGVKPLTLLKSYGILWLIFIPIYVSFLRLQYQNGRKNIWHWPRKYLRSAVHSIDTLTPGINLYAFTELRPFYFDTSKTWKKLLLNIFHRCQQILGWYLAALFLILFSRVWIR